MGLKMVQNGSLVHRVAAVHPAMRPPQPQGLASLAECQTRVFIVLLESSELIFPSPCWKVSCRALGEVWVGLCHPCPWAAHAGLLCCGCVSLHFYKAVVPGSVERCVCGGELTTAKRKSQWLWRMSPCKVAPIPLRDGEEGLVSRRGT